jgi:membrane-associated protease RseP (regulator of RpoE activity)
MGVIDTLTGNTTYLILLILLIVYIPLFFYVRSSQGMKDKGIVTYGPFIMLKTRRGVRLLDRLAKYKRFWKVFGTVSKIMAFFLMAVIILILAIDLWLLPLMMQSDGIGVEYALAIPGLNPMLPLFYGVIGLIVAVGIHELAHGVQTRANDMKVESVGILYAVVPVGAFVEPNEEQLKNSSRKTRSSVYAAGIAINLTLALILFLVMSVGIMGSMSSNVGDRAAVVNIASGSPADELDIGYSSIILAVGTDINGLTPVTYEELMDFPGGFSLAYKYWVQYMTKDGPKNFCQMYLGVYVTGIAKDSPADKAGLPETFFIEKIGSHSIGSMQSFRDAMGSYKPGDIVRMEYREYKSDALVAGFKDVELGERNGRAYLGVTYSLSGFSFTTPDAVLAEAKNPLHGAESLSDTALSAFSYIGKPLRGHSPIQQEVQWWYKSGVLPDGALWVVLQAVFWIFWLNLVLAITNALPAVPFDGGYLFRDGVGSVVDRTHRNAAPEHKERIVNSITRVMSYAMLFILMMVMVAILF